MFWFGLIVGALIGAFLTAFVLNNIHSSKVKALEEKIGNILGATSEKPSATKN